MTFTEQAFVLFLPIFYGLWLLCRRRESWQVGMLVVASLLFYGHNHWRLLPLILSYCAVNWAVGVWIERSPRPRRALTWGVAYNLIVLGYFKYGPLLLATLTTILTRLGVSHTIAPPTGWSIPFGISFYAFTGIAYMVDVYRRTASAERSPSRYLLSVTFFPHLVAGPILRANEFLTQLRPGHMPTRPLDPLEALSLLARGFVKKAVLADRIALAIDPFFQHIADSSTAGVWSLPYAYLYALQIYFDFSGYTDIARGLGLLFGYRWPDNFNLPYLAADVSDFWRRWHISLSRFLRDYLYIPLGGNRGGWWRTNRNLMLTMLLGGLWHGASWSFMLWGGLHGTFLVLHRCWQLVPLRDRFADLSGPAGRLWRGACLLLTFHCVCLAWCFFRLNVLAESLECVRRWVVFDAGKWWVGGVNDPSLWTLLAGYGVVAWCAVNLDGALANWRERPMTAREPLLRGALWGYGAAMLVLAALLAPGETAPPFIYFQF
jgi:D-alanyl-lipoteichoic acid acyltransferase DltB (MBOAT superfamily)